MASLRDLPPEIVLMIVDITKEPKPLSLLSHYFASIARPRVRREALVNTASKNDTKRFKSILSQCANLDTLDGQLLRALVCIGDPVYVACTLEITPPVYRNSALLGDLLNEAVCNGHTEVVKLLIDVYNKPIQDEWSAPAWPLVLKAALAGRLPILQLLLDRDVYPSVLRDGVASKTAGDIIPEIIRLFLAAGLDINARSDVGVTPIHYALKSSNIPAFHALLDAGADLHVLDDEQATLLHYAARYTESSSICRILLDAGLDVNSKDASERPPIRWALLGDSDRSVVVDFLLDAGAELSHRNRAGDTLLHDACWSGNPVYADIFLSAGIDVDVRNNQGLTPVLCAVLNRDVELLSMLIGAGADMDVRNEQGRTVVDIATQQGDESCLDILL